VDHCLETAVETTTVRYGRPMSDLEQLLANLPIDRISAAVGEDRQDVQVAAAAALPALLGGMQANAHDPAGALSLLDALSQHDNDLVDDPSDLTRIDTADGELITGHVFGDSQEQVINQLGASSGVSGGLIRKLLPILAPIVLSMLAKKMRPRAAGEEAGGASGGNQGSILSSVLEQVLAGAAHSAGGRSQPHAGSIITDVFGGLLGGGRR
jgi:hypothetical protein